MSETYTPVKDLKWKNVKIHRHGESQDYSFELQLPEPLADWDVYDYWERQRIESIKDNMARGATLWEVGAEQGWMAALYSKYVTGSIVLVEPTAEFWPGMKAIFDRNGLDAPLGSFCGFADADGKDLDVFRTGWPIEALASDAIDKNKYRNLYDEKDFAEIKRAPLDDMVFDSKLPCDGISIDVEGAELSVLHGAKQVLQYLRPAVWVSIHPDLIERDYGFKKHDVLAFMDDCGYDSVLLAVDHEEHWRFIPRDFR